MTTAMAATVGKARAAGVGLALVRGTMLTAALAYYTLTATQEGMAARLEVPMFPAASRPRDAGRGS